jgi:hypothetical protein
MSLVSRCSSVVLCEGSANPQLTQTKHSGTVDAAWGIFPGHIMAG